MTDLRPEDRPGLEKEPDDWVTGDEPMTGAQASYLQTLSRQAGEEVPSRPDEGGGIEEDRRAPLQGGHAGPRRPLTVFPARPPNAIGGICVS